MITSRLYTKALSFFLILSIVIPGGLFLYPQEASADSSCAAAYLASLLGLGTTVATADTTAAAAVATADVAAATAVGLAWSGYPIGWQAGGAIMGAQATILSSLFAAQAAAHAPAIKAAASATSMSFSECVLKPIALQLAKAMLHNITGDIINWVNGGFKGKPLFVKDLKGLVDDTTDQVIGSFIEKDLKAGFLCSQFSLQVKIALAQTYLPYQQRASCTLKQITSNVTGFIKGDNLGGWGNWLDVTTVPQNNVYGATILAQNELSRKILESLSIKSDTLSWGKGFLGVDTCDELATGVTKSIKDVDPNNPLECARRHNETPGAQVESLLSTAVGSDMRRLEVASDINAILGAVANQLVSQVIKGGVGLLGTKGKSTTYSQAINPVSDQNLSAAVDTGVAQTKIDVEPAPTAPVNPTTGTPTTGSALPALSLNKISSNEILSDRADLTYELNLVSDKPVSGLLVKTVIKKGGTVVPFNSVFSVLHVSSGKPDSLASQYIDLSTQDMTQFSNVAVDSKTPFVLRYFVAAKTTGAPLGTYTVETTVLDNKNNALVPTRTDSFIVE